MAMHEFEYLTESSVKCLDKSKQKLDYRSFFYTLYDFQSWWDAGKTELQVIDILLKHKYSFVIKATEYPDYKKYKKSFEKFSDHEEILENPSKNWSEKNRSVAMYLDPTKEWVKEFSQELQKFKEPIIYFTAGSKFWKRCLKEKIIKDELPKPKKLDLKGVILVIVKEAKKQNNQELIEWWYAIFPMIFDADEWKNAIKFSNDKEVQAIRQIIIDTNAYINNNQYGATRLPEKETLINLYKDNEFYKWWFEPLEEYYNNEK